MNKIITFSLIAMTFYSIFSCKKTEKKENETNNSLDKITYYTEKFRPQFHFSPEENWMNDPNGLVYDGTDYHLFYQYYPDSTVWGPMHWGHATSPDLLHWEHKPIALFPDSLGYIFSGSAIIDKKNTAGFGDNAMVAIFTYHNAESEQNRNVDYQTQGIAYSTDKGETWNKYEGNPILQNPGIKDFRDPKVFWNDLIQKWTMVLAAGNHLQFFSSVDLKSWTKDSEFHHPETEELGVWECPDLFELNIEGTDQKQWVLIISHNPGAPNGGSGTRYFIGDYDGKTFTTTQKESKWLDYGTDNYAGVTFNNTPNNDRILIGWMSNWLYATTSPTEKWRSAMTLPRKLSLVSENGNILLKNPPIDSFKSLLNETLISEKNFSENTFEFKNEKLAQSATELMLEYISEGFSLEILNENQEKLTLNYQQNSGEITLDRSKSGQMDFNDAYATQSPQKMQIGNYSKLKLNVILDESSVEIFVNDGLFAMTAQMFPTEAYNQLNLNLNNSTLQNIQIQSIKRTWPNEK